MAKPEQAVQQVALLTFAGGRTDNLSVKYTLTLPCKKSELTVFLKAARKFTGEKEVTLAEGLTAVFVRGGDIKGAVKGARSTTTFDYIEDAIDVYYDAPDETTYVEDDTEEATPEGEGEDDGLENAD